MSYDIYLFKKMEGKTVEETADIVLEDEENDSPSTDDFSSIKEVLSKRLKEQNPTLEEFSNEEHLELTSVEEGIQISVQSNLIAIHIPYWHDEEKGSEVFDTVLAYIKTIKEATDCVAYDPQTGQEIVDQESKDSISTTYQYGVNVLQKTLENNGSSVNDEAVVNNKESLLKFVLLVIFLLTVSGVLFL